MRFAIVDDVALDRRRLAELLHGYCDSRHLVCESSCYESAEEFLKAYRPEYFSAVFLDNLMGGINGIETARRLRRRGDSVPIIFTTTEESYALDGYTVQAMDYLIKPIGEERLTGTLDRLVLMNSQERYVDIMENRVPLRLRLSQISYVRSIGHYLEIHSGQEQFRSYMTMDMFISRLLESGEPMNSLQERRFLPCCRGYLINLEHVRALNAKEFILTDGTPIPISRSKYREMKEAYASWLFAKTRQCP